MERSACNLLRITPNSHLIMRKRTHVVAPHAFYFLTLFKLIVHYTSNDDLSDVLMRKKYVEHFKSRVRVCEGSMNIIIILVVSWKNDHLTFFLVIF